jgi:hypothetical protein
MYYVLGIALLLFPTIGFIVFVRSRKLLREAKNYERSFKMVPLLIHLPVTTLTAKPEMHVT